jgi:hypothetical protein
MSAKKAAAALAYLDTDIAEQLEVFRTLDLEAPASIGRADYVAFARHLWGLWTVTLAAESASVSEEQVITALLAYHTRAGSSNVCRDIAKDAAA